MCKIYHIDAKLLLFVQRGDEDEYVLPVRGSEVGELFELLALPTVVCILMSSVMLEPLKKREACDIALTDATRLSADSDLYFVLSSLTTDIR